MAEKEAFHVLVIDGLGACSNARLISCHVDAILSFDAVCTGSLVTLMLEKK